MLRSSPFIVAIVGVAIALSIATPAVGTATDGAAPASPGVALADQDGTSASHVDGAPASGADARTLRSAGGAHGDVIEGTVTDADGEPVGGAYVLAQAVGEGFLQNATAGEEPIRASLFELVEDHPFGLYWNVTNDDGSYTVHVPRPGDYDVIAVTPDGVSRLRTVTVRFQQGEQDLTVDPDRVLSVETDVPSAPSGEVAELEVRVRNDDDEAVEELTVGFDPPEGWSIEDVQTDGAYDADATEVRFQRVPPGETATVTVRLRVPEDAARDHYGIGLSAAARTHFVEHPDPEIRVAPPGAATPTATATPTERAFTVTTPTPGASSPDGAHPTAMYLLSAAVFAVGVAFAGYSVWRTGPPTRR